MASIRIPEDIEKTLESFGPNSGYVWDRLQEYLQNPQSVDPIWQQYFLEIAGQRPAAEPDSRQQQVPEQPAPPVPPPEDGSGATALRGVAARIVENMEASLSLPTATSLREIPAKVLEENRRLINQHLRLTRGPKVSFTHIVAWAIVKALEHFPNLNASFARRGGAPYRDEKSGVNIGIAIDVTRKDGSRTLLVPNIKKADQMDFAEFVAQYDSIVRKALTGTLEPSDFQGTSISLTNPGTVGTVTSVPRLMPGQGAIIAMGAIGYEAEKQGTAPETLASLAVSKVVHLTCTYDHRIIQGAESGQFLQRIHAFLLGEEQFYDRLFADLRIPFQSIRWSVDTTPSLAMGVRDPQVERQARVLQLINAYRVRGHLIANLDPLGYEPRLHPELDPVYHGLSIWDLDRRFHYTGIEGLEDATLRDILDMLRETYCSTIGVEYMFIQDPVQKKWIQKQVEPTRNHAAVAGERKKRILEKLIAAEEFEHFLHRKFIGHKRFSIEGAETFLPLLDMVLDQIADGGAERVVIGMAHRGRLNVLANTIGKPLERMFHEFEENVDPMTTQGTGDVKYHLGARGTHTSPAGNSIRVEVAPNPSHLESVNPVVEGMARAMQDRLGDREQRRVIPVLIHGDAAFAGQGIVPETLNLSRLEGYCTGGTIHIVINNQIGFTTPPDEARSSPYSTDVAKAIQSPIFHVNGDDPEAAVRVARIAYDYRQEFGRDVVIDLICYRKYGHNEADEPSYTQPLLYQKIKQHPSVRRQYEAVLLREGVVSQESIDDTVRHVTERLDKGYEASKRAEMQFVADVPLAVSEEEIERARSRILEGVDRELLAKIVHVLAVPPDTFSAHQKLKRSLEQRGRSIDDGHPIDWALAESLAFGTLLVHGTPVRLSGQDSARGTFSQRHSVLYDARTGEEYVPLNHIAEGQARFTVIDSLLSEAAVLGFEFGYSVADPLSLVLWEAQFGDFANNAQVMIDQFISSSATRWQEPSDVVMLLPHGYEGQGPEHSSARLERYLQLCAEENMVVSYPTTPAQYFHLLRMHKARSKRMPLIVMTPKSLLRLPAATSSVDELVNNGFAEVLDDPQQPAPENVRRLAFCSGKLYYDLIAAREKQGGDGVAIVRVEQLYPYPAKQIAPIIARYANTEDFVWTQEEPQNMGAWTYMHERLQQQLPPGNALRYIGRAAAASPATGSLRLHEKNQEKIIKDTLGEVNDKG